MKKFFALLLVCLAVSSVVATTAPADNTCDICEYVIGEIETWVEQNSTTEEIINYLDSLCSMIPGAAKVCDQIVQWGIDDIIQYIENNQSPAVICAEIKLCTSTKKFEIVVEILSEPEDANCEICQYVIGLLETFVANNHTEQQVLDDLEKICKNVPGLQKVCDQIVQYGIGYVVNFIEQKLPPTVICQKIKLCPTVEISSPMVGDTECDTCQTIVQTIEQYIESNYTVNEILEALETFCNFVPGFTQVCDQVIQYGIQYVIQMIENKESPLTVCTQIGLCGSKPLPKLPTVGDNCGLCEYVVNLTESWLLTNSNEQTVVQYLETFCNIVPGYSAICDAIVQYGVAEFVQYVQNNENPLTVCNQLGFCSGSKKMAVAQVTDNNACSICSYIVGIAENWLTSNYTVAEVTQYLNTICSADLPDFGPVCDSIADMGVAQFIAYIQQHESPETVCTQLGLCSSSNHLNKPRRHGRAF